MLQAKITAGTKKLRHGARIVSLLEFITLSLKPGLKIRVNSIPLSQALDAASEKRGWFVLGYSPRRRERLRPNAE
jgi:hypothetical protein